MSDSATESHRALAGGDSHHGESLSFHFGQAACNEKS